MEKSMELVKAKYFQIAKEINTPAEYIFFYQSPKDFGYPHIEYKNGVFHYIVTEHNVELRRRTTSDPDELLHWLIHDMTFSMASDYEKMHRNKKEDFRRILFNKHIELIEKINKAWADEERAQYNQILAENPFTDNKQPRYL